MNEEKFLKTMIELVKYKDLSRKDEIVKILLHSMIKFDKTTNYTRKSYQYWENVDLRVPIPMMKIAEELKNTLQQIASQVYIESEEYDFNRLIIKPKWVGDDKEIIQHDVYFEGIKNIIIQGIREAKYTIWIAVAWFTDKDIFKELLLRKEHAIHIRVITSDETSNSYLINDLENNFEVIKAKLKGTYLSNRLHDKFCIIDFEYVMHGSYNWSKNAQNNDETWAVAMDRTFVKKFADEFMILYNENKS